MADAVDLSRVGAVVTKSITRAPRDGNATWRILPAECGMLNAIGLANVGIEAFVRDYAPRVGEVPTTVVGSVAGFSIDDYVAVAAAMGGIAGMPAVELNVSCPNVHGGTEFGSDGALYMIEWGTGFGGNNDDSGVYRIDYIAGERAPIAVAAGTPTSGQAPLDVQRRLFGLIGTPPEHKKHVVLDGGHVPTDTRASIREVLDWYDRYLGAIK